MESTRENLPERLRWYHRATKDNPLMAPFAPIVEAADEIDALRKLLLAGLAIHGAEAHTHSEKEWREEARTALGINR